MPWLKSCCCGCCKLRTGVIVLGSILLAFSAFTVLAFLVGSYTTTYFLVFDILQVFLFICCILLIVGAAKGMKWLLVPYLVHCVLQLIAMLVVAILVATEEHSDATQKWSAIIVFFIAAVFPICFAIVVYSHFQELSGR